jgi:DNA-binding MarR family transcriptional regulator
MARRRDPREFMDRFIDLSRCLRALGGQAYAELELGTTQAKFVHTVGDRGPISQAELARATGTDPTLAGRALQSLITRGWVKRRRSDQDRRENVLELSADGRRAHRRVDKVRAELAARVAALLDARDLEDFDRIASKILAVFDA